MSEYTPILPAFRRGDIPEHLDRLHSVLHCNIFLSLKTLSLDLVLVPVSNQAIVTKSSPQAFSTGNILTKYNELKFVKNIKVPAVCKHKGS